jgi:hypothetical protein
MDLRFANRRVEAEWRFRLGHLGGISSSALRGTQTSRKCVVPVGMDLLDEPAGLPPHREATLRLMSGNDSLFGSERNQRGKCQSAFHNGNRPPASTAVVKTSIASPRVQPYSGNSSNAQAMSRDGIKCLSAIFCRHV